MKSLIILFALVGLFLTGTQNVNAQVDYSFTITWDDNNCDCGPIDYKYLEWQLWDINANPPNMIGSGSAYVTSYTTNAYVVSDNGNVIYDCEGCYQMKAWLYYYDTSGLCCQGYRAKTTDGDKLVDGIASIHVQLN